MKTYQLNLDSLLSNIDFSSIYDISDEENYIEVNENDVRAFISEQISHFTDLLLGELRVKEKREEYYPFDKISYKVLSDEFGFHYIQCPHCGYKNYNEDWNESQILEPLCLYCENEIKMKA